MPLEDLVGSDKYIDDLQPLWPLGQEFLDGADNHMRGIKNVLQNTFPNITGPVTLTQDEINRGSVPIGTRSLFVQATAPLGWVQIATGNNDWMLTVASDSAQGGVSGGVHDPLVMDKVPAHKHRTQGDSKEESASHTHAGLTQTNNRGHTHGGQTANSGSDHTHNGTTGDDSPDHSHSGNTSTNGNHSHQYFVVSGAGNDVAASNGKSTDNKQNTDSNGSHNHSFTTGGASTRHRHVFTTGNGNSDHRHSFTTNGENQNHQHSFTTGNNQTKHTHPIDLTSADNSNASTWRPYYMRSILCERTG